MLRLCACLVLMLLPVVATADPAGFVRVIDADTWDVGGQRVRLHGIDAPEIHQTCPDDTGIHWACGAWATDAVRRAFAGKRATCTQMAVDRYDRIVARCVVGGADVGKKLVLEGWAVAFTRFSLDYSLDEKTAVIRGAGIHRSRAQSPAAFRDTVPEPPDPTCVIKGNISANGRIYHVPGQHWYTRTVVAEDKGERWFCSEHAARAAGWRRARR